MKKVELCKLSELKDCQPQYALVENIDLVIVRYGDEVSVLYGRCHHRGALLSDGYVEGDNLICGLHGWDYRYDTGVSEYNNEEALEKFTAFVEGDIVYVDADEIKAFSEANPQPFKRNDYLGAYADTHPEDTEPLTGYINELAKNGLKNIGHHGFTEAMGVNRNTLPKWEDIQFLPAQLARRPLMDEHEVITKVTIGKKAQAFHFKGGQGAKTGTGGHLPGSKVTKEIAEVRGLKAGEDAISPAAFPDLINVEDFAGFANEVRKQTGGIPIGFKLAASHLEEDIDFALAVGVDYIILDGRGGGTGAAPVILRNNINVPTIPALSRARQHLDKVGATDVTLIITGGLRIADDFAKALMLGADAIAVSNSALQAIGCLGMRACHTNNCPVGVATQKESLRQRIAIEQSAKQLFNFFTATNELIKVVARSCGYDDISKFNKHDLSTLDYEMHQLTGIAYAGRR